MDYNKETEKILFTRSGGKDSSMALYELKKSYGYEITALLISDLNGYS